jgi:hypothetical protein
LTAPSPHSILGVSQAPPNQDLNPAGRLPVLGLVADYVRIYWLRFVLVSAAVLVPCFWHRRIMAGDLGSHLYNAWLAQLIARGQAPGLTVVTNWTNIVFDFMLSGLGRIVGLAAAEKIAVSVSVLIFFWGAFALMCAAARRVPWFVAPLLAIVSYGWTFEMGFFNYYISLGLSFFALALFWRGNRFERLLAFAPSPLIVMAHPVALVWLVGAAIYIVAAESLPDHWQFVIFLLAAAGIVFLHYYVDSHFIVDAEEDPLYLFTGADQFLLFGARYKIVQFAVLIFAPVAVFADIIKRCSIRDAWAAYSIPLQLFVLMELGVLLLPDGIRFTGISAALALITERLTSISAVLFCCILGLVTPRKWHAIAVFAVVATFFTFLYRDTARLNHMEAQVEGLVRTLPPNQRVLGTIKPPEGSRVLIQHMLDRACIGHCFSYGNYEPTTEMFRVRALRPNAYNMTEGNAAAAMEDGDYDVAARDLPAYQVYQCGQQGTALCIRPLAEGEENDELGIHP